MYKSSKPIGSISILFVYGVTHIGHLIIIRQTGASKTMVILAATFSLTAMVLALIYVSQQSGQIAIIPGGFVTLAALSEILLQKISRREVRPRIH